MAQASRNVQVPPREILQILDGEKSLDTSLLLLFEDRLVRRHRRPNTVKNYLPVLRRFTVHYHGLPLSTITPEHLEHFLDSLSISPRTWVLYLRYLSSLFAWACRKDWIHANPCEDVDLPIVRIQHRPAMTRAEFDATRTVCKTDEEALLVELGYFTGLRLMELLMLQPRDVDTQERLVLVQDGKGGKSRMVPFAPRVVPLVPRTGTWLFESPQHPGYHRAPAWAERTLHRLGKQALLPYTLTCHILRHGFTLLLKESGVPLEEAARMLGHENINTTAMVYARLSTAHLKRVYDAKIGA